ncbi:hypothetical protein COV15_02525 [Candidatus Woesearchaeota archaeon CG10_big_fil_rev_8_21_14_0_10_34_12]|nr:MAG: hypothetical protein COV15_02525 [Candidatus Woesearchaeota archaeon CG10_big_fil_rev_8_21_14_0_10_34_12]
MRFQQVYNYRATKGKKDRGIIGAKGDGSDLNDFDHLTSIIDFQVEEGCLVLSSSDSIKKPRAEGVQNA